MAASWRNAVGEIENIYLEGEDKSIEFLQVLADRQIQPWAHNLEYEMGVTRCRAPQVKLVWRGDTMRMVQLYDAGGKGWEIPKPMSIDEMLAEALAEDADEKKPKIGLGLERAARRILPKQYHNHKAPYHAWLRENVEGCKKGKEGEFLNFLPPEMRRSYNVSDTDTTLVLLETVLGHFAATNYNWTMDNTLYMYSLPRLVEAKVRGAKVDRERLLAYIGTVRDELAVIANSFRTKFLKEIEELEREKFAYLVSLRKTDKGKDNATRNLQENPKEYMFNVGSNKQLEKLFCEKLGMTATFKTKGGQSSFRSAVLSQWGEGGEILFRRRKRLLVLKQSESLYELTNYDGRWHLSLKPCGTATGRYSGGSAQ